jgi:hypothetical protein
MNITTAIVTCIGGFVLAIGLVPQTGWRGIVPLHSTREDVERLVGPPMMPRGITYDLKSERVNVVYSVGGCRETGAQWNVPRGTVIGITVYPQTKLMLSDLKIDLNKFEKFVNPVVQDRLAFTNKKEGLSIGTTLNGEVIVFEYFPSAKDEHLRCLQSSTSSLSNEQLQYFKFDEYSHLSLADEKARLDNFANKLRQEPQSKGYILTYATRNKRSHEALARAKRARAYLIQRWRIEAARLEARFAGKREKVTCELFLVPKDLQTYSSKSQ